VATYPFPPNGATITVILIAPATGANFGGWSYNCTPSTSTGVPLPGPTYYTAAGPNYCTVTFSTSSTTADTNVTVGAIFN
jgi:hypothetical protein